jgi:hypothetical protein
MAPTGGSASADVDTDLTKTGELTPVGLLELGVGGALGDAQNLVVVSRHGGPRCLAALWLDGNGCRVDEVDAAGE